MQRDFGEKEKKKNNLEIFYEAQSALSIFTCQFYSLISSNEFSYSLCSLKAGASAFKYRNDFAGGYLVALRFCSASVL